MKNKLYNNNNNNNNNNTINPIESLENETYLKKTRNIRETALYLTLDEMFDLAYLYDKLKHLCKSGQRYSVITRVCFVNKDFSSDNVTD